MESILGCLRVQATAKARLNSSLACASFRDKIWLSILEETGAVVFESWTVRAGFLICPQVHQEDL